MANPTITLTTDFGHADPFVGVMKGVILRICPDARIVDISHEVTPFEIAQGAFLLRQAYDYFPSGTVHVAVVDPGVGSARRPILVETENHFFIGPDNGVLAMVYESVPHRARLIENQDYFLYPVSQTFHGRDIFAPTAAHLANGINVEKFGPLIEDHLKPTTHQPQRTSKRAWTGAILHIDRFGNLITSFHIDEFPDLRTRPFEFAIGTRHVAQLAGHYAELSSGEPFLIVGSSGYLEVSINQGSAAKALGCVAGSPCELHIF